MKIFGNGKSKQHVASKSGKAKAPENSKDSNTHYANGRPKKKKKNRGRTAIVIAASVVAVLAAGAAAIAWWIKPPETEPPDPSAEESFELSTERDDIQFDDLSQSDRQEIEIEGEDLESGVAPISADADRVDGMYTFLVVGMDDGNGNTDTIMVGMLNTVDHELNIVSIPRDTLVNVAWTPRKVNTIYSVRKGIDGLVSGIKDIIGYSVDSYAVVDLEAFKAVVDCIGGVDYDVPIDMYYSDPAQNLSINLKKGMQHLNGEQAMGVVRFRKGYANADIGRIGTQQDFLMTVAKQLLSIGNITKINEFAEIFTEYVDTNMSVANLVWYGTEYLKLSSDDIHFYTIPANYYDSVNKISYVTIYVDEWLELLNDSLNPYDKDITAANLNILTRSSSGSLYATSGVRAGSSTWGNSSSNEKNPTPKPTVTATIPEDPSTSPTADPSDAPTEPGTTEDPGATDDPDATDNPQTTDDPQITDTPQTTEMPPVTDPPAITPAPTPTVTQAPATSPDNQPVSGGGENTGGQ